MAGFFWENILNLLTVRGMTQKDLAEKSGVKRTVINNGIGHNHNPRVDHAYAVAKALGVTVEYLFTGIHPDGLAEDAQAILAAYSKLNAEC
jgi:transcriptional regulator with XRE-family HTH domain